MSPRARIRRATLVAASVASLSMAFIGNATASLWAKTGSAAGTGRAGALAASVVTVPSTSTGTVAVSWTASIAPTGAAITYVVDRKSGAVYAPVCGTGTTPLSSTSCNDTGVASGTYQYRVTAKLGTNWATASADSGNVTVTAAASVGSVSPNNRGQNSLATTVTVTGNGFTSGAGLNVSFGLNTTTTSVTFVNATTITASVAVASTATTGLRNVVVTNGGSGGATLTCTNCFTVNAAPTLNSGSPAAQTIGQGSANAATFTIAGTGFVSGFVATTSDLKYVVTATTFTSSTSITVTVRNDYTNNGTRTEHLVITNPDGGSVTASNVLKNN